MFEELKETMVKEVKKYRRIKPHHMQNSNEETKITKKKKVKNLELNGTVPEIKTSFE